MSKIIKASQITGEYKIEGDKLVPKKINKNNREISKKTDEKEGQDRSKYDKEAREIIARAREEAEVIIKKAREEARENAEKIKEEGYQKGYEEGFLVGQNRGEQQLIQEAQKIVEGLENVVIKTREELDKEAEKLTTDIIKLSFDIASRIINTDLEFNPEHINNIVFDMVQDMTNFDEIHISVSPELIDYINLESFQNNFTRKKIKVTGDNRLDIGDCIITTELGGRDGTIDNKLGLLEKELLKEVGYHEGD